MSKKYIVTNATATGNYTPSVFEDEKEAYKWLYELAWSNAYAAWDSELDEYLNEKIHEVASSAIERMEDMLKEILNLDNVSGKLLTEKEEELEKESESIALIFNTIMNENNIPYLIDTKGCTIYDYEEIFNEIINRYLCLEEDNEDMNKKYLEYFASTNKFSMKYSDTHIILYYGDSYNDMQLFS